jgi:D-sedoheptulose 7-phosphate isomerase
MKDFIAAELRKSVDTLSAILGAPDLVALIEVVAGCCVTALRNGNKILLAGNGGSAADAQHLAAELVGRLSFDRPGLAAFALTTDTSALTGIGNDYGFERLFSRQVEAVGRPGDIFFGISTSGRSPNVLNALRVCRDRSIVTIGLTGQYGGDMPPLCDHCLRMPSTETPKVQEGHIVVGHILFALVEREMFGGPGATRPS